ncbi:hypothetical protein DSL72_006829 [Monilinia vaccinii-corymbosi]|uniref:Uncharacterized protein n=1 Tax=Monilinia vaccinii-corymbosi TaxID=61207 RepID=A0A8A3PJY2_9HELO|nr:hypothetical protein DSL72_006829 [Monilinia vaccinii-corymbosi]
MSEFPAAFCQGDISQGASNINLAEQIMKATMESARNATSGSKSASDSDDDTSFGTQDYSETETSETGHSVLTADTDAPKKALLPSEQPLIPFQPARVKRGERATITPKIQAMLDAAGIHPNPKYEGEITTEVLNDLLTPTNQSCAVHITNIHPKADMKDLFPTIRHGKVYSVAWNGPNHEWAHAAARLCFCAREAAEKYLAESETGDGIRILGQRVTVEWNRNKKCPISEDEDRQTRVLQLRGPRSFGFSAQDLEDFFGKDMKLHIISRKEWNHKLDQKVVQLAFCGIKAQSRMAFRCFKQKVAAQGLGDKFDIRFAPDPCDPTAEQERDMFMPRSSTPPNLKPASPPPRTLEIIRSCDWRTGSKAGPRKGGSGNFEARGRPKYKKGFGPDAANWRRGG